MVSSPTPRPRVEGSREEEILDATVEILLETGFDRLTMDAVATRAKASKATLYRRWDSKNALVIDALVRTKSSGGPVDRDTGSLRGDLVATYCGHGGIVDTRAAAVLGSVVTALLTDAEFAAEFRTRFLGPKLAVTDAIYQRAIARGEVAADADVSLIAPALAGILMHRSVLLGEAITDETVQRVVDQIILPAISRQA